MITYNSRLSTNMTSLTYHATSHDRIRKCLCILPNQFNNFPGRLLKAILKKLSYELSYPLSLLFTNI